MTTSSEKTANPSGLTPAIDPLASRLSPLALSAALPVVRKLGLVEYESTLRAMQRFTAERTTGTRDELWLLEHFPVYTYGVAGRAEHLPPANCGIPVIKVDRGGQVTFHGPGQLIVYALIDLRRRNLGVRDLVRLLEQAVLDLLAESGIRAERRDGAPGVYVDGAKIAALGLRIRSGCSYHGLSLNVDVDLEPFNAIDPCGYPDLTVTRMRDLGLAGSMDDLGDRLIGKITQLLGATEKRK
jgi:lipoyl(octanoyl) transferase